MHLLRRAAATALTAALFATLASAQQFSIPEGPLKKDDKLKFTYVDPTRAGKSIVITVTDDDPLNPHSEDIPVQLDDAGKATIDWRVRDWNEVYFVAPDAPDEWRTIA